MKPELRWDRMKIWAADLGPQSSVPDLLGEHILQNHLEFRLEEGDEIYEGYGRRKNAYPYRQYNGYTRERKEKEIQDVYKRQILVFLFYAGRYVYHVRRGICRVDGNYGLAGESDRPADGEYDLLGTLYPADRSGGNHFDELYEL